MKQLLTLRTSTILSLVALLGVFACPTLSRAASITVLGSTTPTPGPSDVYFLPTSSGSSHVYTNAFNSGGNFGETFTTGSSAVSYTLTDVILEVDQSYGNTYGNFSAPISIEAGGVSLDTETASITGSTPFQNDSGLNGKYIEFALSTPVLLLANTQYSFNIGAQTTGSGGGTIELRGANTTLTNASGFATGRNNTGDGPTPTNFVFDIGLTATVATVPEPSTWAMMLGGLGMLVIYQRRRSKLNL
jgi:hypothetical protein